MEKHKYQRLTMKLISYQTDDVLFTQSSLDKQIGPGGKTGVNDKYEYPVALNHYNLWDIKKYCSGFGCGTFTREEVDKRTTDTNYYAKPFCWSDSYGGGTDEERFWTYLHDFSVTGHHMESVLGRWFGGGTPFEWIPDYKC